ncbi:MAG: hypothetical protein ACJAW3_001182 [Lentimonas sp.]|jgi:hypothetical protein
MPSKSIKYSISQYSSLVAGLEDQSYRLLSSGSSTVGAHIRHIIDRMNCFERGLNLGQINYDLRERNPEIETNRDLALKALEKINDLFENFNESDLAKQISIIETLDSKRAPSVMSSTIGREIADLIAHNTHHLAIIKEILKDKIPIDENFGKAPSTIIHEKAID